MSSGTSGAGQVGDAGQKVRVWVDGGSRGNPGPSGIGVLIEDMGGGTLATISRAIGVTTNNVAEYLALLAGLEKVQALGATEVEVISDSELLVRQMLGQYRVKNLGLRPLHAQARLLAAQFAEFSIRHLGRDHNAKADGLVNRALDEEERAGL